jgi:uncharacterized protein (UPF0332 family)
MITDGTLIHYQQHINGQFVPALSGKTIQSMNPSLGMPWATIPDSNQDDANLAISAAREAFDNNAFADAIYHAYNAMVNGAKALLLDKGINQSTQTGVIKAFDEQYAEVLEIESFINLVLQINKNEPSAAFAEAYLAEASDFLTKIKNFRSQPEIVK